MTSPDVLKTELLIPIGTLQNKTRIKTVEKIVGNLFAPFDYNSITPKRYYFDLNADV